MSPAAADTMTSATALQWGLLLGYLALSVVALVSLRRVEARRTSAAVLFLAAPPDSRAMSGASACNA